MCKSPSHHKKLAEGKKTKKHTERDPFLQSLCSQSHSVLNFLSIVHIFNPVIHSSSHCFCFLASLRKQAETVAEKMSNRIKNVNGRNKNENRM